MLAQKDFMLVMESRSSRADPFGLASSFAKASDFAKASSDKSEDKSEAARQGVATPVTD